jgi:hypothetical protein
MFIIIIINNKVQCSKSCAHAFSALLAVPTPGEHEVMMGDWVVRNAIARGTFGHVYAATHARTRKAAAAKELWRTKYNSRKVDEDVIIAKYLMNTKHVYKYL